MDNNNKDDLLRFYLRDLLNILVSIIFTSKGCLKAKTPFLSHHCPIKSTPEYSMRVP
jgi:hypothetical protein